MVLATVSTVMGGALTWGAVYVDVETEEGAFTIEMDAGARNGGAAFLGLAEGWLDWVDPRNGAPKHGERYYEGTAMSWVKKDEGGEALLVGNLGRPITGADGQKNWNNGAGVELFDDVAGATGLTARSVAMVQQDGPHTLDGDWAVLLKNADDDYGGLWSRVGMVVSNWGVVVALAGREVDENGWMESPVTVTGMRVHGDQGEIAAWRAEAATNGLFPKATWVTARATESGIRWMIPGSSRFTMETTENLCGTWGTTTYWNEREACDAGWMELGMPGATWFLKENFLTLDYTGLSGPAVAGKYSFRVEWETKGTNANEIYQYDLDVGAGTGMVRQLDLETQTNVLKSAPCNQFIIGRSGAHSTGVSVVISDWGQIPYYFLGEARSGDGAGRFRMWEWMSDGNVWGSWIGRAVPSDE